MLDAVGMNEINKIFAVIDAMGIHREAVVIPLGTGKGRVRRLPSGKLEIIVDAETPIDVWLEGLPDLIRAAQSAGRLPGASACPFSHCWPSSSSTSAAARTASRMRCPSSAPA